MPFIGISVTPVRKGFLRIGSNRGGKTERFPIKKKRRHLSAVSSSTNITLGRGKELGRERGGGGGSTGKIKKKTKGRRMKRYMKKKGTTNYPKGGRASSRKGF